MKCLVLSFFMGYNGRVYKRGEYVDVADDASVKRLVRERCIELMPSKAVKTAEAEEVKVEESPSPPAVLFNASENEEVNDSIKTGKSMVRKQGTRRSGGAKK